MSTNARPVQRTLYSLSLAVMLGGLASCNLSSGPPLAPMPVKFGMTKADLQARFGIPLKVEKHRDGREDWYYKFGVQEIESQPVYEAYANEYEQTVSVGRTFSSNTTTSEQPVHLSRSGRVFGVIPKGRVVMEK